MTTNRRCGLGAGVLAIAVAVLLLAPDRRSGTPGHGTVQAAGGAVDVAIVLTVDCSWSVDGHEYDLQMKGLAMAFRSRDVIDAIHSGPRGRIAVALVQWAAPDSQHLAISWQIIETQTDALLLAARIETAVRQIADGATSITAAIDTATHLHQARPFPADRRVIDVSSDGINNAGGIPEQARDLAVSRGITVNALAILNEVGYLHHYFRNHVIGGPAAFVEVAADYSDYHRAIKRKLLREIGLPLS